MTTTLIICLGSFAVITGIIVCGSSKLTPKEDRLIEDEDQWRTVTKQKNKH